MQFLSPNPEGTQRAARLLAQAAPASGLVVILAGPLGAGKTEFAKGLAAGLGIAAERVTSPTFAICNEYATASSGPIDRFAHVDGYRLSGTRELEDAGLLDWLVPGTLVAIEWGDRFRDALPADRLEIVLSRPSDADGCETTQRRLSAVACGSVSNAVLAEWGRQLRGDTQLAALEVEGPEPGPG